MAPSTPRKLVKSPPSNVARRTRSMSRVQSPPPAPPSSFVRRLASSAGLRLSSLSAALPSLSASSSSSAPPAPVAGPSSTPAKRKAPSKEASLRRKSSILRSPKKRHRRTSSPISVSSSSSSALSSPTPARKRVRVEAPSSSPVPRPGTVRTSASLLALLAAQPGRWELAPKGEECDRCRDEQSRHPDFPCVRPCGTNRGTRCASCTSGVCSFLPPSPAKQRKVSTTSRSSPVARSSPPAARRSVFATESPSSSDELPGLPPPLPPSVSFRAAGPGAPLWELSPSPPPRGPRPPRAPPVVDLRSPSPIVPGAFVVPAPPSPPPITSVPSLASRLGGFAIDPSDPSGEVAKQQPIPVPTTTPPSRPRPETSNNLFGKALAGVKSDRAPEPISTVPAPLPQPPVEPKGDRMRSQHDDDGWGGPPTTQHFTNGQTNGNNGHLQPQDGPQDEQSDAGMSADTGLISNDFQVEVKLVDQQADPNSPLYSVKSFEALPLHEDLLKGIYACGFKKPSKIQEKALPLLLNNP
ncbi:hypothetical protein TREMEDRAFT_58322 [Tremella mesenterica DSM 1558]|uniref:uncharacterized protein n=1 Tax=Tremella mesenterica (strain ATCC 24925 / CBS 8224 / DSM 1558 / NBRC 9311 / NRRL Y-6157 / RJB 2259-6 / UBC 559-6) TaxID=578456 RepID=UPI0003F49EEA|nr:uncharacterized protein TREMEDRAFT_58322 [Tremella mesenterica DSM 1558]EIW72166.1 hypothetical protein TREMEDRAFT_58322 [Tremella mesenterica DSM 1558]